MDMKKIFCFALIGFALQGCSVAPHVEDWQRERISEVPTDPLTVNICFNHNQHSRKMVYDLAREECAKRITEVQNLVQGAKAREAAFMEEAEGQAFEGSVQRSKRIQAMIANMQLKYVENDKWDCPLITPNRIKFECVYSEKTTDSHTNRQSTTPTTVSPDLPPELPDDLKPQ